MTERILEPEAVARFSEDARRAVYDVIALRRDVRHFDRERAVDPDVLLRVLGAAPRRAERRPLAALGIRRRP